MTSQALATFSFANGTNITGIISEPRASEPTPEGKYSLPFDISMGAPSSKSYTLDISGADGRYGQNISVANFIATLVAVDTAGMRSETKGVATLSRLY